APAAASQRSPAGGRESGACRRRTRPAGPAGSSRGRGGALRGPEEREGRRDPSLGRAERDGERRLEDDLLAYPPGECPDLAVGRRVRGALDLVEIARELRDEAGAAAGREAAPLFRRELGGRVEDRLRDTGEEPSAGLGFRPHSAAAAPAGGGARRRAVAGAARG